MPNTHGRNRLDDLIDCLETLHHDAHEIFDAHTATLLLDAPEGSTFGQVKLREIIEPAGRTIDYIAALKLLNKKVKAK
jgi:hypothetical protein